jgi:DNA modification methylase
MKFETVLLSALSLDPSNVRKHSRRNLDAIKASLRKFGQQKPIVVDAKGIVLAGNGTLTAAQELGWTKIEITRTELAGVEATAFAIADNRTAELAEWDEDGLAKVLESLKVEDADLLAATGYDAAEVDKMIGAEVTQDEVPEPPADPITKTGDLWILGDHRVLCGDSTNAEQVARLMNGAKAQLMVTDPPYGVNYDANWRNEAMPDKNDPTRWKDGQGRAVGKVENDDRCDWREAWALFSGDVAYVWHAPTFFPAVSDSLIASAFAIRSQIVWVKHQFVISRGDYHWKHELCAYGVRKGAVAKFTKDRTQTTVWEIKKPQKSETGHSTQKPIECMARPIQNHEASEIYDPFLGSGTTLIAAEQLNRKCYGLEISPAYCDVIVKRWENLTGKKAVLDKPTT